ncbi:hypothetical protein GCM10010464_31940 [Pseudonocardia yunnanensis]
MGEQRATVPDEDVPRQHRLAEHSDRTESHDETQDVPESTRASDGGGNRGRHNQDGRDTISEARPASGSCSPAPQSTARESGIHRQEYGCRLPEDDAAVAASLVIGGRR